MNNAERDRLIYEKFDKIARKLLRIFGIFCKNVEDYEYTLPLMKNEEISDKLIDNMDTYTIHELNGETNEITNHLIRVSLEEDVFKDNTYKMMYKGKTYTINLFDSPEACGYNSILLDDECEEYLFCHVAEYEKENIKNEIFFGFDKKEKTFLELSDILCTIRNYKFNYRNIEKLEKEFKGINILEFTY